MKSHFFHALWLGLQRHPIKALLCAVSVYGVLWTFYDSIKEAAGVAATNGALIVGIFAVVSLLIACFWAYPPARIGLNVANTTVTIDVFFGDIFEREGFAAIPVNEFFDSELGLPVSRKSLHGIVIERFFGGHANSFDSELAKDLSEISSTHVHRAQGKKLKFPIGTCAQVSTTQKNFLLFAMCATDITNCKASTTVPCFVESIEGLCAKARTVLGGEKLLVPLAGSGTSGLGLDPQSLLRLILLVLTNESKKRQFAQKIELVIHRDWYDQIDLQSIKSGWR